MTLIWFLSISQLVMLGIVFFMWRIINGMKKSAKEMRTKHIMEMADRDYLYKKDSEQKNRYIERLRQEPKRLEEINNELLRMTSQFIINVPRIAPDESDEDFKKRVLFRWDARGVIVAPCGDFRTKNSGSETK